MPELLTKSTTEVIVGTDPKAGHFVTFNIATPADLTGYSIDFNVKNNTGSSDVNYAWNGAAIVVPEPSAFGLILGGFAFALISIRRRR